MNEDQFENMLGKVLRRRAPTQGDVDRVLKRLAGPLPRQTFALRRLPDILLDWQFAPAWPRVAALACCAVLGFFVGFAGVDRQFGNPPGNAIGRGISALTFEPDPFTGARP